MIIMSYMDSEGAVDPAILSEKNNYDEDSPTLTEFMAGEEVGWWLETINIEINALEKRVTSVKVKKYQITTNTKILLCTWDFKRKR